MNSKETITYGKLEEFIKSVFKKLPAKYTLTYKDSDQDMICLLNDVDMKIMFQSGLNKVRIEIQECSEDFYDPTQQIVIQAEPVQKVEEPKDIIPEVTVPEVQIQEVKVPEVVPEKIQKNESCVSEVKSIDDSISQKLSQMMPEIISKIKEQVLTESKIRQPKKVEEEVKEKTEVKPESSNSQVVHAHVTCDECQASPIVGIRYKCVVCPDFDVCEKCEAKSTHAHPFLKIKHLHQTPIKIFAVIDDQDESLEINGQKVPLPGLNQGIQDGLNLLTGLFGGRKPEECRESFKKCRDHWKKFAHHMKDNMRANCPYFQAQKDQKVEEKVEVPKTEEKVEIPKSEVKVEAPKPEQKKEQPKTQPVITEEKKPEIKVVEKQPEQLLVETANYISEIMNVDFRKAYRFAANYPGQTKEQILMKYLEK